MDGHSGVLHSITDWVGLEHSDSGAWVCWVYRIFTLEPTDRCVHYYLHITATPEISLITANDYQIIPPTTPPYKLDVTDYVALGENVIGFRVTGTDGAFGHIHLQPVPCDEP